MSVSYMLGHIIIHAPGYILYAMGFLLLWAVWKKKVPTKSLLLCWAALMVIYSSPLPVAMMHRLEVEAKEVAPKELPQDFDGFVFLGGCFSLQHTKIDGDRPIYNPAGSRLFDFVLLAKAWPQKPIVLTGTAVETEQMKQELVRFGIDETRLTLENQSRNTEDNANKSFELVKPQGKWVLVTSAFHMKRSAFLFEKAGWSVIPWPVGFLAGDGSASWWPYPGNGWAWYAGIKEALGAFHLSVMGGGF